MNKMAKTEADFTIEVESQHLGLPDHAIQLSIAWQPLRESLRSLEELCVRKKDAALAFAEGCDAVAAVANIEPSVLRAYVTARVADKLKIQATKAEQMQLLYEEL